MDRAGIGGRNWVGTLTSDLGSQQRSGWRSLTPLEGHRSYHPLVSTSNGSSRTRPLTSSITGACVRLFFPWSSTYPVEWTASMRRESARARLRLGFEEQVEDSGRSEHEENRENWGKKEKWTVDFLNLRCRVSWCRPEGTQRRKRMMVRGQNTCHRLATRKGKNALDGDFGCVGRSRRL